MKTNDPAAAYPDVVLFGGCGFIGLHLTRHLITHGLAERVWLADIREPDLAAFPPAVRDVVSSNRVRVVSCDVRKPLDGVGLPQRADLVVNLAAVHREPGHEPSEYYQTNVSGAQNVTAWAEGAECHRMVFTSSIAPYGPSEALQQEGSLAAPESPYGGSKLVAEHIHRGWQRGGSGRRLLIVRPGVVFGPGEGGNVTRLIRAVLGHYFVYAGSRHTRKAGGYVKELCEAMMWTLKRLEEGAEGVVLCNFSLDPPPTVADYVHTICRVAGVSRIVPGVPYVVLMACAYFVESLARPLGLRQPINPVRVRKLVRSNNIDPAFLREAGYKFHYTLEEALRDWRSERPEEWGGH